MISRVIKQINEFVIEMRLRRGVNLPIYIECQCIQCEYPKNNVQAYYIKEKLFTEEEVRLLADSVIYSRGISEKCADIILNKLEFFVSNEVLKVFRMIAFTDVIKRTESECLFSFLKILGTAIEKSRQVLITYKESGLQHLISPYYLVMCNGFYYLLGSIKDHRNISFFRLDRIETAKEELGNFQPISRMYDCDLDGFHLKRFMKQHNRMYFGRIIWVKLRVQKDKLKAIEQEFYTESVKERDDASYEVEIKTTAFGICNWIINLGEEIVILEHDHAEPVNYMLYEKAKKVLELYGQ